MAQSKYQYLRNPPGFSITAFGFTLLEVMIALAVMSIVLVSVYRMHSQSLAMNTAARFYTVAPLLAQNKMAQLEALSSEGFPNDSGDFGEQYPGYSWQTSISEVSSEVLGEVANDLKRIDLTVSYNNNQFSHSVRTYRFHRDEEN
jgi:general secretion pathway protein I